MTKKNMKTKTVSEFNNYKNTYGTYTLSAQKQWLK